MRCESVAREEVELTGGSVAVSIVVDTEATGNYVVSRGNTYIYYGIASSTV